MSDVLSIAAQTIIESLLKKVTESGSSSIFKKLLLKHENRKLFVEHLKRTTLQLSHLITYRPFPQHIEDVYIQPIVLDETISLTKFDVESYDKFRQLIRSGIENKISSENILFDLGSKNHQSIQQFIQNISTISPDQIANNTESCVILGEAGAGKSSFLQYICYKRIQNLQERIPIFVQSIDLRDTSIIPLIESTLSKLGINAEILQNIGKSIAVYIDGLDELDIEKYKIICYEIEQLFKKYPNIIVCAAMRSSAYKGELAFLGEKTLLPFDEYRAVLFVQKWFNSDVREKSYVDSLTTDIRASARISELSSQPLLLCLMCTAVRRYSQISRRPSNLYQQCVDALLWEWDSRRLVRRNSQFANLDLEKKTWIHAELSYILHTYGSRYFRRSEVESAISLILPKYGIEYNESQRVLDEITANHGLIVKLTEDVVGFPHLAIQEYFAAKWLSSESRWQECVTKETVLDPWWIHTFSLVAGMLSDATRFIEMILSMADIDDLARMKVVSECLKMDPVMDVNVRAKCISNILGWYHNGSSIQRDAAIDMLVGLDDAWVAPIVRRSLAGALPDRYLAKLLKRI